MLKFNHIDGMWLSLAKELLEQPVIAPRGIDTREIIGWGAELENINYSWLCNRRRKLDPRYAAAELLWYVDGSDDISMLLKYAPSYTNFADNGRDAYGAYGPRLMHQLVNIASKLCSDPNSRQAVAVIWRPEDLVAISKDIPCTVALQFFIRDNKLILHTHMRSNDMWKGFPYDVFCFTAIQHMMANELRVTPGKYVHTVGSMHMYCKNEDAVKECFGDVAYGEASVGHHWAYSTSVNDLRHIATLCKNAQQFPPAVSTNSLQADMYRLYMGDNYVSSPALHAALRKCES